MADDQTSPPSAVVSTSSRPQPCIAQVDGENSVMAPKLADAKTSWVAMSDGIGSSERGRTKPSRTQLFPSLLLCRTRTQLEVAWALSAEVRASTAHMVRPNDVSAMTGAAACRTVVQCFPASTVRSMRPPHGAGGTGSLLDDALHTSTATKPTSGETKVIDQIGGRSRPTTDQCRPASVVERSTWHGRMRPPVPHAGLDAKLPRRKPSEAEGNASALPRTAPVDSTRQWAPPSVVLAKIPAHFGEQDEPATNPSSVPAAATAE